MHFKVGVMVWWCWWWCRAALAAETVTTTPCLPKVVLEGASPSPQQPWLYAAWQHVQIRARLVPTSECQRLPDEAEYCWHLDHRQGEAAPQPAECGSVTRCSPSPVLARPPYNMTLANYTLQALVRLPGTQEPRRCLTAYFTVQPSPILPFGFAYGPRFVSPHHEQGPAFFIGFKDPDKDPALTSSSNRFDYSSSCITDDERAKQACERNFNQIPGSPQQGIPYGGFVIQMGMRPGYSYNITLLATEKEWPHRSVETFQEMIMLKTGPNPNLVIECQPLCELQRVLPTEKIYLSAKCIWTPLCLEGVPINYTWHVEQEGRGPLDLTVHTEQGRASGVGFQNLTILPGALQPGVRMAVQVRAHYAPTTPWEIKVYQDAVDEYNEYQENNA